MGPKHETARRRHFEAHVLLHLNDLYRAALRLMCWEDTERLDVAASAAGPRDLEEFAFLCVRSEELGDPRMPPRDIHDG